MKVQRKESCVLWMWVVWLQLWLRREGRFSSGFDLLQIRAVSDRLCKAHGLSIVLENGEKKAVSYAEWLRQKKSQPTFRSMLEADLHDAIEDANDLGHFFPVTALTELNTICE